MPQITIDETRRRHIFRDAPGHFPDDNAANRQRLLDVANRPDNLLGTDHFGNSWFAERDADGAEIWVQVRNRQITNDGINSRPRFFEGLVR